jgi:ATP-dependent exoDNAse (exonuclease V) beta subunit
VVSKYLPGVEGTKKGTIIHEVLRGRDVTTILKEYGEFSEEHVRQCEEIVSVFLSSDLMKRVKRSYCEVPFVVTVDGRRVTGKIDRLCQLDDGSWVVIDYKSEVVDPEENSLKVKEFKLSMGIYTMATKQLVGEKPVVCWLYFTETGEFEHSTNIT